MGPNPVDFKGKIEQSSIFCERNKSINEKMNIVFRYVNYLSDGIFPVLGDGNLVRGVNR